MITVESTVNPNQKKKSTSIVKMICLGLLFLIIGSIAGIWILGSPKTHKEKNHLLYSSFDSSSSHKNLLNNLDKSRLNIVVGKKSDGLVNFIEHYANKLVKNGRTVYFEDHSGNVSQVVKYARDINEKAQQYVGFSGTNGDWILVSQNGALPMQKIKQIQTKSPDSKILIITTSKKPKIKGFKVHTFPKIEDKHLDKSIMKTFSINKNMIEILRDHHETQEELLNGLEVQAFTAQQILKNEYVNLDSLDQQGVTLMKKLCQAGEVKAKLTEKEPGRFTQYGVILIKGTYVWQNKNKILNLQLFRGVNCKNKVASQSQLRAYRQIKQKEAADKKKQEAVKKGKDPKKKTKLL